MRMRMNFLGPSSQSCVHNCRGVAVIVWILMLQGGLSAFPRMTKVLGICVASNGLSRKLARCYTVIIEADLHGPLNPCAERLSFDPDRYSVCIKLLVSSRHFGPIQRLGCCCQEHDYHTWLAAHLKS